MKSSGNSLAVQWLRLHAFTAKGTGSIPGQRTKIPQAAWCSQKRKRKKENDEKEDIKGNRGERKGSQQGGSGQTLGQFHDF